MNDNKIHLDREMYVVWAVGKLNDDNLVTKHDHRSTGKTLGSS